MKCSRSRSTSLPRDQQGRSQPNQHRRRRSKKAMITNQTFPSNLMITAEVRVNSWNAGDMARAGVGLDTNPSNGDGYNLVFHGTKQVQFLDDKVTWGNAYTFHWQVGTGTGSSSRRSTGPWRARCGRRGPPAAELDVPADGMDRTGRESARRLNGVRLPSPRFR